MKDPEMSAARRRTDRAIRESFLKLLQTNPLDKITVQDLCEEAEINRTTFYRYYDDVYALYDRVSQLFFDRLFTDVVADWRETRSPSDSRKQLQKALRASISRAVNVIEQEKELCYLLLHSSNHIFARKLVDAIQQIAFTENAVSDEAMHVKMMYMCGGILSVILDWIRGNCRTDKQLIIDTINRGVKQAFRD